MAYTKDKSLDKARVQPSTWITIISSRNGSPNEPKHENIVERHKPEQQPRPIENVKKWNGKCEEGCVHAPPHQTRSSLWPGSKVKDLLFNFDSISFHAIMSPPIFYWCVFTLLIFFVIRTSNAAHHAEENAQQSGPNVTTRSQDSTNFLFITCKICVSEIKKFMDDNATIFKKPMTGPAPMWPSTNVRSDYGGMVGLIWNWALGYKESTPIIREDAEKYQVKHKNKVLNCIHLIFDLDSTQRFPADVIHRTFWEAYPKEGMTPVVPATMSTYDALTRFIELIKKGWPLQKDWTVTENDENMYKKLTEQN